MPGKSYCQVKPAYSSMFEPVNLNLTKMSGYNPVGYKLKIEVSTLKKIQVPNLKKIMVCRT